MPIGKLMLMGENEICPYTKQLQGTQFKYNVSLMPATHPPSLELGNAVHHLFIQNPEAVSARTNPCSFLNNRGGYRSGLSQTFPSLLSRHDSVSQAWDRLDSAVRLEILTGAAIIFDVSSGQDTSWGLLNPESPNVTRQGERVKVINLAEIYKYTT